VPFGSAPLWVVRKTRGSYAASTLAPVSEEQQANGDWASQLVDELEGIVKTITAKTTQPLRTVARGIVYGLCMLGLGVAMLLLVTIGAVRGLTNLVGGRAWLAHTILGGIFVVVGLLLWSKRRLRS
jgi:hypothetical protein